MKGSKEQKEKFSEAPKIKITSKVFHTSSKCETEYSDKNIMY